MEPYVPDNLPLDSIDWAAHVSLIGQANAALARYDGMLQSIVNPAVFLAPLTTQEAVLSSRIEGTQASMEEVLEYEADPREAVEPAKSADIQEIINYRKAMGQAVASLEERPLCLNLIKELHAVLMDSVRGRNKSPGQFRRTQNYIGPQGVPIEQATFVPPAPERLPQSLDNWEKYVHFDEKDGLVQLAVVKAQFEIIHPFLDGNGRVGRMLVPLFLFTKKLLSSPMFYLSAYFEADRDAYITRLQAISREHDWNGWIQFFLTAVVKQAAINTDRVRGMLGLYENMKSRIVEITHSQFAIQALDAIFSRPIFRGADFQSISGIPTRQTAAALVRQLQVAGILKVMQPAKGRRSAMLGFPELINLVEGRPVV
jgi:Fic family protein